MAEKVVTESCLRKLFLQGVPETFCLEEGQLLTPAAAQFLSERKVRLTNGSSAEVKPGGASLKVALGAAQGYVAVADGKEYAVKPAHLTHLISNQLIPKNHPRIIFRGQLDRFQAEVLLFQGKVSNCGDRTLAAVLGGLLSRARAIMRADVLGETLISCVFFGLDEEEIWKRSHDPEQYYGLKHLVLSAEMDPDILALNRLRTMVREVEIAAITAFANAAGIERIDIVQALNRLSSVIYVMMLRAALPRATGRDQASRTTEDIVDSVMARIGESGHQIPVELSARHAHLSEADAQKLFGGKLTMLRELSQPGQYLCQERVCLIGPGGRLENVAVLGPVRKHTQVEVSLTDARILDVKPPVRQSGDTAGATGIQIGTELGTVDLEEGLLIPGRHIHMRSEDASAIGISDMDFVRVRVGDVRALVFEEVLVRVNENYRLAMHIDFDEGNACGWTPSMTGYLLKGHL